MSGASFQDLNAAARMNEAIKKIARDAVLAEYPRPRFAEVLEINVATRTLVVQFPDEEIPFSVPCGAYMPLAVGQVVRIFGPAGGRYVDEVIGAASFDGTIGDAAQTFVCADEAAMLASGADRGDFAIRTDTNETYILTVTPATTLGNWQVFLDPGAEAVALNVLANHESALNPHPIYLTEAEGDARYVSTSAITAAITAHEIAADPHAQYVSISGGDIILPTSNAVVPLTIRGHATQAADLLDIVDGGGVTRVWVTAAGVLSGVGSGLTALNASNIASGTLDAARLPAGVWTSSNDGSGSGLDADLLDGHDASYFLTSGVYTAADVLAKLLTVDGATSGLDADLLDGQDGAYYLAWANVTGKPDPVVTVTLTGDVTGTANATLTDLGNGTITVATSIAADSVALGADTTGDYIATLTGTTNQVTVSGAGTEGRAVVLSLPQDIHSAATPTFARVTFSQTTGTAPFVVSSTTVVTNLNADTLDGQHGAYYAPISEVEALMGDLHWVGLYDASAYVGTDLTKPHPTWSGGTSVYRHGMYWVVTAAGQLDFIDSDLSGRYSEILDSQFTVHPGDWVIAIDPTFNPSSPSGDLTLADMTFQVIPFSAETYVSSMIAAHAASADDPHSAAGYLTSVTAGALYAPIVHVHTGEIETAIAAHEAETDPHPIYLTETDANALYALDDHLHTGVYEVYGSVSIHEAATDPHPQYVTIAEGDAAWAAKDHLHDSRYALLADIPTVPVRIRSTDNAGAANNLWVGVTTPVTSFSADMIPGDLWVKTFDLGLQAPSAPAGLTASAVIGTEVVLAWSAFASGVSQTEVQVDRESSPGSGSWTNILDDASAPFVATYTDTGRLENTTYSYRVRGRNAVGWGPYSTIQVTTANDSPAAPTSLSVTVLSSTSLRLAWTASTAADLHASQPYEIFLNGTKIATDTASPYDFTGLVENTTYTLGVRAKDTGLLVSATVTANGTTSNGTPTAPGGLSTSGITHSQGTLTWTAVTGISDLAHYEVFKGGVSQGTTTGTSWTFTGLSALTAYTVGVRSVDTGALTSSTTTTTINTTANPDTTPPADATITSFKPETSYGNMVLRFTCPADSDFDYYTVQRSLDGSSWTDDVSASASPSASIVRTLAGGPYTAGQTVYARVKVRDSTGNWRTGASTSYTLIASPVQIYAAATNQYYHGAWNQQGAYRPLQGYYSDPAYNAMGFWFYGTAPYDQLYYGGRRTITGGRILLNRGTTGTSSYVSAKVCRHGYTTKPAGAPTIQTSDETALANQMRGGGTGQDEAWNDLPSGWAASLVDGSFRGIACYSSTGSPYINFDNLTETPDCGLLEFSHLG